MPRPGLGPDETEMEWFLATGCGQCDEAHASFMCQLLR